MVFRKEAKKEGKLLFRQRDNSNLSLSETEFNTRFPKPRACVSGTEHAPSYFLSLLWTRLL